MSRAATRVALVTGGLSGIGLATVCRLAADGVAVGVVDIDTGAAPELAARSKSLGWTVAILPADVTDPAGQADAFATIAARLGPIEIVVSCAGVEGRVAPLTDQAPDDIARVIDLNVTGSIHTVRLALRAMIPRRRGAIVTVSSIYGRRGQPRFAVYAASKHAITGLTRSAALEAAPNGIRVNAVAPGPVATPLLDRCAGGDPDRLAATVPLGRIGSPDEVSEAIAWLCSDAARFVTGHVLAVDGGMSAQARNP